MLSEEWELAVPLAQYRRQADVLHLPTVDYDAPGPADLDRGVEFILTHVRKYVYAALASDVCRGEAVYVHCNGGKGRSVVATIAALMTLHGWSKEAAYTFVRGLRKIANMRRLGGIMPQWRALRAYEARHKHA